MDLCAFECVTAVLSGGRGKVGKGHYSDSCNHKESLTGEISLVLKPIT